jgi:hypothetical protein
MYQVNGAGETWAKALGVALVKDFDERDGGGVMSDDKTQQPFQITTDEDKRYAFKKLLSGTEPLAYGEEPANCPANSPGKLDGSNELEQLRAELAAVKAERDADREKIVSLVRDMGLVMDAWRSVCKKLFGPRVENLDEVMDAAYQSTWNDREFLEKYK